MFGFNLAQAFIKISFDTGLLDAELAKMTARIQDALSSFGAMGSVGIAAITGLTAAAGAAAAGMAVATKVAGDLQQQYTTLQRVTGMTAEQTAVLAENLQKIATSKPGIPLKELNSVAQFAGRLGVGGANAANKQSAITKVASDLADLKLAIDDMNIEDAAIRMIRILKVFGKGTDEIRSFGSALVAVDNASTASASELLEMVNRLQGAGATLGATIPQLIALAGAARDTGLEVDAGSTALSQLMMRMSSHGEKFAAAIKMTEAESKKFASVIKSDPMKAVELFLQALKRLGPDGTAALEELHMSGRMTGQQLMQMAKSFESFDASVKIANKDWETQKSLNDAVALAMKNAWSHAGLLTNKIEVLAGKIGMTLLPALTSLIDLMSKFADLASAAFDKLTPQTTKFFQSVSEGIQANAFLIDVFIGRIHQVGSVWGAVAPLASAGINLMMASLNEFGAQITLVFERAKSSVLSWIDTLTEATSAAAKLAGIDWKIAKVGDNSGVNKAQAGVQAAKQKADEAILRFQGEGLRIMLGGIGDALVNKIAPLLVPPLAGGKTEPSVAGAGMPGAPAGKFDSFGLEEARKRIQESIAGGGAAEVPKKTLAVAQEANQKAEKAISQRDATLAILHEVFAADREQRENDKAAAKEAYKQRQATLDLLKEAMKPKPKSIPAVALFSR